MENFSKIFLKVFKNAKVGEKCVYSEIIHPRGDCVETKAHLGSISGSLVSAQIIEVKRFDEEVSN